MIIRAAAAPAQSLSEQLAVELLAPTVREFIWNELDRHPDVQAARAHAQAAGARTDAAGRPLYNPELGFEYEDSDAAERTVGLSQTIDWTGKRAARKNVSSAERRAAIARLQQVREAVAARLVGALAGLASAEQLDALAGRRLALIEHFLSLAEQRRRAGDLSQVELDLARLAAGEARIARAAAAVDLADAERRLIELTGGIGQWPTLPQSPPSIDPAGTDIEQRVAALPAMRAGRAAVDAADSLIELRRRERRPDPTFSIGAGKEGDATLGRLSFTVPLHIRNDFSAEVEAARADARAAGHEADSLQRTLRSRLLAALRSYAAVHGAWSEWLGSGETSLDRQIELLDRFWRVGELSTTDYLVQLEQALDTRAEAERLRGEVWQRFVELLEASALAQQWAGVNEAEMTGEQP